MKNSAIMGNIIIALLLLSSIIFTLFDFISQKSILEIFVIPSFIIAVSQILFALKNKKRPSHE